MAVDKETVVEAIFVIPLRIDIEELDRQIIAVLESDMPQDIKDGIHNLLGTVKDEALFRLGYS